MGEKRVASSFKNLKKTLKNKTVSNEKKTEEESTANLLSEMRKTEVKQEQLFLWEEWKNSHLNNRNKLNNDL